MRNIRILVEYDGTAFHGWQVQRDLRTVQREIQKAVEAITSETVAVEGAGRTDRGVHARGQVANFTIQKDIGLFELRKGLNAMLPPDIRIKESAEVDLSFHARFSAVERRYAYYIATKPTAIGRQYCWFYSHPLDVSAMRQAGQMLIGMKSFRSFCLTKAEVNHYVCDVRKSDWEESEGMLVFTINANRFLHNMVRCIVGTCIRIGTGKLGVSQLHDILEKEDRRLAGFTAPASGLVLEEVLYGEDK